MSAHLTPSHFSFEPLEKLSLGENIARHLQELLLNGTLRPGDYLPSQREMASRYGTSVAAVREAISILSAAGLLDARPGKGTLVLGSAQQAPSMNLWLGAIHDEVEAQAFMDTRQVLEHYTIREAAARVNGEQLTRMRAILREMQRHQHDPELFVQADLSLHFAIAQAAGNPVTLRLLHAIHTPLVNLLRAVSHKLVVEGRFARLYANHEDIVNALEARDPGAAIAAFDRVIDETLHDDTLAKVLGAGAEKGEPLGDAFFEDLRWNLTRLIGPMAEVIVPEAASEIGVGVAQLSRRHLRDYLDTIAGQLPPGKQGEWQALADLLLKRYENA